MVEASVSFFPYLCICFCFSEAFRIKTIILLKYNTRAMTYIDIHNLRHGIVTVNVNVLYLVQRYQRKSNI